MRGAPRARLARAVAGAGAVAAQVSQAVASLVLQVLVSRTLGEVGLSTYALLYGGVVLATAVVTGLVGDTLTVADRSLAPVRAGLAWWALVSAGALAAAAVALALALGGAAVGVAGALALGAAVAAFVLEDCLRRLLMAGERFWRLVAVDGAALVGALATVVALHAAGRLTLTGFLVALALGQVVGGVAAVALLPRAERWLAPWRGAALAVVVGFGTWRAAQQTLRPGMLTAARALVIATLGAAAYGQVEAARLLVTPLALVVGGVGSLLLVRYARSAAEADADGGADGSDAAGSRAAAARQGVRRADRAAGALLAVSVVMGGAATAVAPVLGPLVTGGRYAISQGAVAGWVLYAATAAVVLPYGALAAVLRRQRAAFVVRLADSAASVALLAVVLAAGGAAAAMPWALSAGSLVSAAVLRALVLSPGRAAGGAAPPARRR